MSLVILSAFVPVQTAQQMFPPTILDAEEEEALGEEDLSIILTGTARDRSKTDQRFRVAAIATGLALARLRPAHC